MGAISVHLGISATSSVHLSLLAMDSIKIQCWVVNDFYFEIQELSFLGFAQIMINALQEKITSTKYLQDMVLQLFKHTKQSVWLLFVKCSAKRLEILGIWLSKSFSVG
jgi:hypothetical protein